MSIYFRWEGSRRPYRERRRLDVASKTAATHWAKARIAYLLAQGEAATVAEKAPPLAPEVIVPTLREFGPRWIEGYARAKRQKPSGIDTKESILRIHLYPAMGDRRLDEITDERVARFQASLADYSRKTLNNILSVLGKLLRVAVKWKVIAAMPCAIELTKNEKTVHAFYDADAVRRLIDAARNTRERVLVLLGVHAGLRRGEMCGLRWIDVDFTQRQIVVRQSVWRNIVGTPKSGHGRVIDLSAELEQVLLAHRHRRPMVLCAANGAAPTPKRLRDWLADLQGTRRAAVAPWRPPRAPPQLLFEPGRPGGTRQINPGTCRSLKPVNDARLHAPEPGHPAGGDRALRCRRYAQGRQFL